MGTTLTSSSCTTCVLAQNIPNTRIVATEIIASTFNIPFRVIPEPALVFVVEVGACVDKAAVDSGVEVGVEVIEGVKSPTAALVLTAAGV